MAIDYGFETSAGLAPIAMRDYFADLLHCDERFDDPGEPPVAVRREIIVTSVDWPPEEEPPLGEVFGVDRTVSVGFREDKFLTRQEHGAIFRDMLTASAQFLEDHPGSQGLFSLDFFEIYLQRIGESGIVLAERLRGPDYNYEGLLDDLLAKYPIRDLGTTDDLIPDD